MYSNNDDSVQLVALFVSGLAAVCLAGGFKGGYGGGFGGGFGGGYGGGHGYARSLPGPSFLVKSVHHVSGLSRGGNLVGAHLGGFGGGGFGGGGLGGYGLGLKG
ncbi:secreted GGY protein, putative [Ixodes scapularis]|uniref:Secreted GGY protein, putative n=1 Tax=Ixodes scapularis TaxID=6945 RepID=B7PHF2_IXOSC|nr:secreted GGY protein, putative [Ixodes scapularis]|eukprot:XP_002402752.1 secreted GGY protein, putative [Ixodes scapularis]